MRTKHFLLVLFTVIGTSLLLILLGPAGQQNDSIKSIVSQTHEQLRNLKNNLREASEHHPEMDPKYLAQLGFTQSIYNGTRSNFSVVTYALAGEVASTILYAQNIAAKLPMEQLLIYDLGLLEMDLHALQSFCNSSRCTVITYDVSTLPSYITDENMHAFRPIIIHDALARARTILFTENSVRLRGTDKELAALRSKTETGSGVMGWTTQQAVTSRTHPKMFDYFDTDADNFLFLPMVSLDFVFFVSTPTVNDKVMLPWVRCMLTPECLHPIGAQSGGCKYNKKPQYRYSGCHGYDTSAFNIILGLTFGFDESKYSTHEEPVSLYMVETLEQATKILENRRKNITDTSEHPFTDE
ncbi:uncharacterized protein LOC129727428 [Wyeomyia smithii]|uniref:uncharacterized protein LOC129727428 n=1 Tax=Wyeomyia smithii TaxID=174621 RepID=UPI002467E4D9|nr:uncharacterized protein LOC129727428 [Wyeomyia smithii]XP_055541238.1 uncharacterized protein LOC129727428 [Wyeomyia smithii]